MRGVTVRQPSAKQPKTISTRTPHAGSDLQNGYRFGEDNISTRTPHAGSDFPVAFCARFDFLFQPALPMRGVTEPQASVSAHNVHFNPHSPCGE